MRSVIAETSVNTGPFALGKRARRRFASNLKSKLQSILFGPGSDTLPRGIGWIGFFLLFGATGLYGTIAGGHGVRVLDSLSSMTGLAIAEIRIGGQVQLDEIEVLEALDIHPGSSLVTYNAGAALDRLSENGWVASASVRKIYPGTLKIELRERKPLALWQRGALISLIDRDGNVITDDVSDRFAALPLFVGHGAQTLAQDFLALLDRYPAIRSRVRAAVYVSARRWDLVLDNEIEVRLPENNVEAALAELVKMNADAGLMTRDIVAVDLRLDDEIIVRLSDGAMSRRKATVKSRGEAVNREADT